MYLNKLKFQKKIKKFKNRKKQKLVFSDSMFCVKGSNILSSLYFIFFKNRLFVEMRLYRFFFLKLRKLSKRKKIKTFVLISCNHCFSKKSKNSRMGKGKGKFTRYAMRYVSLKPIFIFYKLSYQRALLFKSFLNKKSRQIASTFVCLN